jgi:hypothetical protein
LSVHTGQQDFATSFVEGLTGACAVRSSSVYSSWVAFAPTDFVLEGRHKEISVQAVKSRVRGIEKLTRGNFFRSQDLEIRGYQFCFQQVRVR